MPVRDEIIELEQNSATGSAYERLREQWRLGERDREVALHVMFLAWDLLMEPAHLTGRTSSIQDAELVAIFNEAHASVLADGDQSRDAEALYVVGLMAHLAPWLVGPHEEWEARSGGVPEAVQGRAWRRYFS